MSDQLHPTRLEWDGRRGLARHDGVSIELHKPPSATWHEVHYTPGIQAEIREHPSDPRREMTADEIRNAQRWLAYMAHAARQACAQTLTTTKGCTDAKNPTA